MKKLLMVLTGAAMAVCVLGLSSVNVKAALPCSYDIIRDANGNILNADQMLAQARTNEAAFKANYEAVKNSPTASALEKQQAADAYANAVNVTKWWVDQVNNSKTYLKNINDRAAFEDKFATNRSALFDLTKLQAAKLDADGAREIANGVAKQIADVKSQIASYEQQVLSTPSVQPQLDSLRTTLANLEADYAAKNQKATELEALFNTYLATLGYASYDKAFEDYQYNREINRGRLNWDPAQYPTK